MGHDAASLLSCGKKVAELGPARDAIGGMFAAHLRQDVAIRLEQEHVDVRIDVQEDLSEPSRASCVMSLQGVRRRTVSGQDARGERQIGDVVIELRLERPLRVADSAVDFVDQLAMQQP